MRLGEVGDWRASDEDFLRTFRLPIARCDALKRRHPFPREARIHFDEPSHTYTIDGSIVVPRSVTGLVHQYTNEFNPSLVIAQMRARDSWEWKQQEHLREDGEVMTNEEIIAKWARNGEVQRSRGTLLHFHCEAFLNYATIEGPPSPEFCQFLDIYEHVITTSSTVYRTEISMFSCGLRVAGQADCLCLDRDGHIIIWDWKRSKQIRMDSDQQMRPPLDHLPDCNYWAYSLQLNVYRYILESEYSMHVSRMLLGVVHPLSPGPLVIEVPRMDDEIALIVERDGSPTPVAGEDAPFFVSSQLFALEQMPATTALVKAIASEAAVGRGEVKKVLNALSSVLVHQTLAKGSCKIPNLVVVQRKVVRARQAGVKKVFGKDIQVGPKPATIKVVARPLRQLKDLLNP